MRLLHDMRAYPPRVSVSVNMTTSNVINLPYKVEGTDRDERLAGELLLPFCTGTKPLKFKIDTIIPLSLPTSLFLPLSL